MKLRIYYAHSVGLYNTRQELRDISILEQLGFEVINPNHPAHDDGYKSEGMAWFNGIIDACDALAFRANPDGSINAGVAYEIERAASAGRPVIELPCSIQRRTLTIEQTREHLRDTGHR